MNSKLTLPKIARMMSEKSGRPQKDCEALLKVFFRQIGEALADGESVKAKGFGTFKLSDVEARKSVDVTTGREYEIPAHKKVVFIPAKELATAVNAPFEMFETIELEDNLLEEELMEAESASDELSATTLTGQSILEEEKLDALEKQYPAEAEDMKQMEAQLVDAELDLQPSAEDSDAAATEDNAERANDDESTLKEPTAESTPAAENAEPVETEEPVKRSHAAAQETAEDTSEDEVVLAEHHRRGFSHGFLWGILATVCVIGIGVALLWVLNDDFANMGRSIFGMTPKTPTAIASVQTTDSLDMEESEISMQENEMSEMAGGVPEIVEDVAPDNEVVPTQPSDARQKKVVYDTITNTRFLNTMARRHYGNTNLWPYIYKENEKVLGHPNRIRPGTPVVIPDLSKYGVDPKNPADITKAKEMAKEIYDRYK